MLLFLLFILILSASNCSFAITDSDFTIKNGDELSVIDCVKIAFKNSPKIKRQKYNLDIATSNVGIAKAQYFPVINAGVGFYNENNSDRFNYTSHYQDRPSVGVSINQLVWNFGKTTSYIKMEEFYKIGAEYEYVDSLCSTLFDIKLRYYELLKAQAMLLVAENNVEINKEFVKLSQSKNKADIKTAELNLSNSKVKRLEAKNDFKNAQNNLSNSMYIDYQPNYSIKNTKTFTYKDEYAYKEKTSASDYYFEPVVFTFPINDAVKIAYENSPDLKVLDSTKNAMIQSLTYIKKTYLPDLNANVGYGLNNSNISANNSLQVGVNLSSSVNLMELKHNIKGAQAQVNLADTEIELFKKDLFFRVKRAINDIERTENQIPTAKLEVTQAIENLHNIENEYKNNKLNYIALQDARKDYNKAIQDYISSLYDYNMSLIELEMAMHYHLVDIHHKTEHAVHYHASELIEHLNEVLGCDEEEERHDHEKKNKK